MLSAQANRLKTKVEHKVPITVPMQELHEAAKARACLVSLAATECTLSALAKRLNLYDARHFVYKRSQRPAVPHGLKSTLG